MRRIILPNEKAPGIWIPDRSLARVEHGFAMGISGHVETFLRDANTGRVLQHLKFRNIFTNAGLDYFGTQATQSQMFSDAAAGRTYLAAGESNVAPANTDTVLGSEIATGGRTNTAGSPAGSGFYVAGSPDYFAYRCSRRLGTTQGNGTIRELGMFTAVTAGTMLSRALPKDSLGVPTIIPKTSAAVLDILWEYRWYPPQGDTVEVVNINGVNYTITMRAANITATPSLWHTTFGAQGPFWATPTQCAGAKGTALVARTAAPANNGTYSSINDYITATPTVSAYGTGNYYRDATWSSVQTVNAGAASPRPVVDYTGLPGLNISIGQQVMFQFGFAPSMATGVPFTIRTSWNRYP